MDAATSNATINESHVCSERSVIPSVEETKKPDLGGTFKCAYCQLEEHYDYKGGKPPFARQISFTEDTYVMKDPWSLPNKGQVLVIGGECNVCKNLVCLGCSIFYAKRFCRRCANDCVKSFPSQLHSKIKNLNEEKI